MASKGRIFDIQHYAVHDGPGIRTSVFLKGCPLSCAWCSNPESQAPQPELRHHASRCRGCLACVHACARGGASAEAGRPKLERSRCGGCADWACLEACPQGALLKVGGDVAAQEVLARVAADKDFYDNSGGGVTFSGGEPLAQPDFLAELLEGCRGRGIHTAVETCGFAPARELERLEPLVDLFLYDLKIVDPERHRQWTGRSNELILGNLRLLADRRADKVVVRVPLIPEATDSEENLSAVAALCRSLDLRRVELLPYHGLGADKYEELGRTYRMPAQGPDAADMARASRIFESISAGRRAPQASRAPGGP
jgi:pyruvate formate lyase activating enzyme